MVGADFGFMFFSTFGALLFVLTFCVMMSTTQTFLASKNKGVIPVENTPVYHDFLLIVFEHVIANSQVSLENDIYFVTRRMIPGKNHRFQWERN